MTRLQAMRWFAEQAAGQYVIFCKGDNWCMSMISAKPKIFYPTNYMELNEDDMAFRKNFISRCPVASDCLDVTLTILHELGHYFTKEVFLQTSLVEYANAEGEEHFKQPCEIAATDWAIKWIENDENINTIVTFENAFLRAER